MRLSGARPGRLRKQNLAAFTAFDAGNAGRDAALIRARARTQPLPGLGVVRGLAGRAAVGATPPNMGDAQFDMTLVMVEDEVVMPPVVIDFEDDPGHSAVLSAAHDFSSLSRVPSGGGASTDAT